MDNTSKNPAKIAIVCGAACGGCDVAIVNLHERLLDISDKIQIVFWHTATDFKIEDLEKIPKVDIGIYIGSIRNEEHIELAKKLREKSQFLVAFGSCACFGGLFSLGNVASKSEILKTVYLETPNTENPEEKFPGQKVLADSIDITLPKLTDWCLPINSVVNVDIYVQGCPPIGDSIEKFYEALKNYLEKGVPPERGSVVPNVKTLCDICPREKPEKIVIRRFKRVHEGPIDDKLCFLAQGIICLGPITVAACDAACIKANMPCRGCLGSPPEILDRAAKFISTIASLIEIDREKEIPDEELMKIVQEIVDPLGTFHRFTFGSGIFNKKQEDVEE